MGPRRMCEVAAVGENKMVGLHDRCESSGSPLHPHSAPVTCSRALSPLLSLSTHACSATLDSL